MVHKKRRNHTIKRGKGGRVGVSFRGCLAVRRQLEGEGVWDLRGYTSNSVIQRRSSCFVGFLEQLHRRGFSAASDCYQPAMVRPWPGYPPGATLGTLMAARPLHPPLWCQGHQRVGKRPDLYSRCRYLVPELLRNRPKWFEMVQNRSKSFKICPKSVKIGQNSLKMHKIRPKWSQNAQNQSKMVQNQSKSVKMVPKWSKLVQNWSKLVKIGLKWSKSVQIGLKMVKIGSNW